MNFTGACYVPAKMLALKPATGTAGVSPAHSVFEYLRVREQDRTSDFDGAALAGCTF
ncbi:MAG: hypothetical protein K2X93_25450 [Candidatus Obscuribacterales bacterium]|nr:hypothetical protein [Candidatus Obscuribacterales bacterium]